MNTTTYKIVRMIIGAAFSSVVVAVATPGIEKFFKLDHAEKKTDKKKPVIPCTDIEDDEVTGDECFMEA